MEIQEIRVSEIDPDIIPLIRGIDKESESYKGLVFSIGENGQQNPIIIRELTDEEKKISPARYGIIDGHHRFAVAKDNNAETILARMEVRQPHERNEYLDKVMAYRMNEASIKMTPIEKGKLICELSYQENKDIPEICKELFNLERAMSYRLVREYRKSIGEFTVMKPRASKFNAETLNEAWTKIPKANENFTVGVDYTEQLEAIQTAQKQLRYLQTILETRMGKRR